jgi:hypothetical protein
MTPEGKRELLEATRARYLQASKVEKGRILDEFVANTGYHRKYAIHLLKHGAPAKVKRKRRGRLKYTPEVVAALVPVWEASGHLCGKRLQPFIGELVDALERHGEIVLEARVKRVLCQMSAATMDRALRRAKAERGARRHSTTKPGTLLKQAIPVRTFASWDEHQPGFVEVDLVAHCGDTIAGPYLHTLCLVDVHTHWCELAVLPNKGQAATFAAIKALRQRLPFSLLGLDSDNGSEFINDQVYRYCLAEHITFTRSRPYQRNDQAHVEQKNWSVVRRTIGYARYESSEAQALIAAIYTDLCLHLNFFQPTLKLRDKTRAGGKVLKRYEIAQTPCQRVLAAPEVAEETKAALRLQFLQLNPLALRRRIEANLRKLWRVKI